MNFDERVELLQSILPSKSVARRLAVQTDASIEIMEKAVVSLIAEAVAHRKTEIVVKGETVERRDTVTNWVRDVMLTLSRTGVLMVEEGAINEHYDSMENARALSPKGMAVRYPRESIIDIKEE